MKQRLLFFAILLENSVISKCVSYLQTKGNAMPPWVHVSKEQRITKTLKSNSKCGKGAHPIVKIVNAEKTLIFRDCFIKCKMVEAGLAA